MKKLFAIAALFAVAAMLAASTMTACSKSDSGDDNPTIAVTGIKLSKTTLSMVEGMTETLVATVEPENATDKAVKWESSNTAIATVTDGKVIAVKEGKATITVTTEDGAKTAKCEVTVGKKVINITDFKFTRDEFHVYNGIARLAPIEITPANADLSQVKWTIEDPTVVSIQINKSTNTFAFSHGITKNAKWSKVTATVEGIGSKSINVCAQNYRMTVAAYNSGSDEIEFTQNTAENPYDFTVQDIEKDSDGNYLLSVYLNPADTFKDNDMKISYTKQTGTIEATILNRKMTTDNTTCEFALKLNGSGTGKLSFNYVGDDTRNLTQSFYFMIP